MKSFLKNFATGVAILASYDAGKKYLLPVVMKYVVTPIVAACNKKG